MRFLQKGRLPKVAATDADGRVDADWLAAILAAMDRGADVVAGWVELNAVDWGRIPLRLHQDDARECAYDTLCDEIHALLDPDPHDPWPRYTQHSGASIAVAVHADVECGGVPLVASGEDRALIAALRMVDARLRHDPAARVSVSGRVDGRAEGGMAETIRRRLVTADEYLDERLEPARMCALRARSRAAARRAFERPGSSRVSLASLLALPASVVNEALRSRHFGRAWQMLERASPELRRVRVPVLDLPTETLAAKFILAGLRAADGLVDSVRVA